MCSGSSVPESNQSIYLMGFSSPFNVKAKNTKYGMVLKKWTNSLQTRSRGKTVFPAHTMKTYIGSGGIDPLLTPSSRKM
jgi:hypothetical protein